MSPFPNVGYVTGLDGNIIPLPRHVIQRSTLVSATDAQTYNAAALADMPNMTVTLNLEVPCMVLLLAQMQLTVSVAQKPISLQFTDAANNAVGLLWAQDFHNTQDKPVTPLIDVTTGVVGSNTWKLRWGVTVVSTASVTNRYMIALAFPS